MDARQVALAITRWLPGWFSSLVLAVLFFSVWRSPDRVGWAAMDGLQSIVVVEVLTVNGFLLMVAGRDQPREWLPVLYGAAFVAVLLNATVGPMVAVLLPLHLVFRVAGVWADSRTAKAVVRRLLGSVAIMALSWLAVGLLPLPSLGWTAAATPPDLWWEVVDVGRGRRLPFALPAWACLYFLATALVGMARSFVRLVERTSLKSSVGTA